MKDSIMYPFYGGYKSNFTLHKEDITKIQGLYGDNGKILSFFFVMPLLIVLYESTLLAHI